MLRNLFFILFSSLALVAQAQKITFDLENTQGQVQLDHIQNKYILLAFGYTSCPDICPTTLYEFANTLKQLNQADAVLPIFVTIDPIHDSAQTLEEYVRYFDPRILGLTGSLKNIKHLSDQLGATFGYRHHNKRIDVPQQDLDYTVYHSSLVYLLNPDHELIDVFDYQIGANDLAQALNRIMDHSHSPSTPQNVSTSTHATATTSLNHDQACSLPDGFHQHDSNTHLHDLIPIKTPIQAAKQQVALLNIWALWCAPCRVELPILNELAKQNTLSNLSLYNLNLGAEEHEVRSFFNQHKLTHLSTYTHEDLSILKRLGGKGLPFNALFVNDKLIGIKHGIIQDTQSLIQFAQCIQ